MTPAKLEDIRVGMKVFYNNPLKKLLGEIIAIDGGNFRIRWSNNPNLATYSFRHAPQWFMKYVLIVDEKEVMVLRLKYDL